MSKLLTPEQIEKYKADGFVYPVDVMRGEEAQRYLRELEAAEALQGKLLVKGSNFKPHLLFKWADELAHHPKILDAVEDLIAEAGADLALAWYPPDGHDIEPVRRAAEKAGSRVVVAEVDVTRTAAISK